MLGRFLDTFCTGDGSIYMSCTALVLLLMYLILAPPETIPETQQQMAQQKVFEKLAKKTVDGDMIDGRLNTEAVNIPRKTFKIKSEKFGHISVTRVGHDSAVANILSIHDIGMDHRTCFNEFFQSANAIRPFSALCVYHIDLPGQVEMSEPLPDFEFTLEDIAHEIENVRKELQISSFVGFGVGVGANIMLRYATTYVSNVHGLVLIGLCHQAACLSEALSYQIMQSSMKMFGWNWLVTSAFSNLHFSHSYQVRRSHSIEAYKRVLSLTNTDNMNALINAVKNRNIISTRRLEILSNTQTLLVCGSTSPAPFSFLPFYNEDQLGFDVMNKIGRKCASTYKVVSSGHLVTVERPADLLEPLSLFLNGLGYI